LNVHRIYCSNPESGQCRLQSWARWEVARGPARIGVPCQSMYVVYGMFLMFKHWFCWKYKYNKYMFNFIDNYTFIPVSGCVGMGSSAHCFARGPKMPIPRHYSYGPRKLNIILTQLRCNASFLNYDLCKVKILSNASCNCGAPCENSPFLFWLW
jgi:hypothetical protein